MRSSDRIARARRVVGAGGAAALARDTGGLGAASPPPRAPGAGQVRAQAISCRMSVRFLPGSPERTLIQPQRSETFFSTDGA